ncbi:MAG: hypothetical protein JW700_03820 [Candidatus Aenigmarchaeota archaeon]|nr:hypothetical protein [Candidatus Aenigmarchaeota archaeon]
MVDIMKNLNVIKELVSDKTIKKIFKTLFKEKQEGNMGISISKLSEKTGIERHRLVGMLEVLVVLGFLVAFNIGMAKAFAPSPLLLQVKELVRL